ncbi:MAG: arylsulfatase [Thermoleophilia bacterium]|nr:arylsulfatase [Thermoleophilia bacterium]
MAGGPVWREMSASSHTTIHPIRPVAARRRRVLLLVLDGLRPGSINAKLMPNLARLAAQGVTYTRSRTGFPSETMVGAGELMSGAYPERSGVTSNLMMVPSGPSRGVELKSLAGIEQMRDGYGGRALASTSIFEALGSAGKTSAMIGKEGPAELASLAGADWTVSSGGSLTSPRGLALEETRASQPLAQMVEAVAGPAPASGKDDDGARSRWLVAAAAAVDAAHAPDLLTVWLTDPDKTQHGHGLGTASQRAALLDADRAIGQLFADLEARGVLADFDIVVTSDHGFSDHVEAPKVPLADALKEAGLDVSHVVASGNQHLVRFRHDPTPQDFAKLRATIAAAPFAKLVRTVIDNPRAGVAGDRRSDGRLTGRDLRQGSTRAADAYVIYQRDDVGVPGPRSSGGRGPASVMANPGSNKAGHGSLGWSDINNTLVVAGPSFDQAQRGRAALRTSAPAGIFDIAPTIAHLLGVATPGSMQGRVLAEALAGADGGDGHVGRVKRRRSVAWTDVTLGARTVRTGLVTEWVGAASYLERLITRG